ncbi:MAG: SurA N-terminal domain-containing protein [Gammaproteobacteria bacterium]|nr:SurA N-terminal domain-containing protein [Gammaproteobacteria bacterium]
MLQSIRDRTQGWIAGVIISLVILSFALWGIHSYLVGGANTSVIAKVNGVEITKTQYAAAYERLRRQMQVNMGSSALPPSVESELKQRALQALVNMQVLEQGSTSQNFRVSSHQIDNFLESMPEFQVNGQFSLARFQQLLATTLLSAGDFLNLIKTTLLIDQPRLGIIFSAFALPNEVDNTIALVNQERDVAYLTLPQASFLNASIVVSDDEAKAYYDQHINDFKTPEQVSVEYLELSVKDIMASFKISDEALKTFYNENINSYTQPMQWNLESIVIPLAPGTTEEDAKKAMAKAVEQRQKYLNGEKFTGVGGGKVITLNQLPSELQKPVSNLTKADQISDPVRTEKGIILIKAVAIKDAQVQPYAQVVDKVKEALTRQQAEEKYAELREKLANVSYESPESLQAAAKALNLNVKTTDLFTQEKGTADVSANKKIRDAAFSGDVLNSQNNSDVIQINPDTAIVLRIKSHIAAAALSFAAVKNQIVDIIKAKKAEDQSAQVANEIKQKLQNGGSPEQIEQQYHYAWNKLGYIGRYSTKVDSAILYTAFRLPRPDKANQQPSFATVKIPSGYAVVALRAVRNGTAGKNNEQYEVFADQVQTSEGTLEYKLYETSLTNNAKIVSYVDTQAK